MSAGTKYIHIRGTTLITSQADKLLASIKAFADNGASRTLLLPKCRLAAGFWAKLRSDQTLLLIQPFTDRLLSENRW